LETQHIVFNVENMNCESCRQKIQSSLSQLNGIYQVIVDLNTKHVAAEYDEERLDISTIKGTIEDLGYKVK